MLPPPYAHCAPFQSTHPLRGATLPRLLRRGRIEYFNPRTPCGVRLHQPYWRIHCALISIHAPLAGCDSFSVTSRIWGFVFQSTHPLRGATHAASRFTSFCLISIHAPLAGCDLEALVPRVHAHDFNPRTPCGVRRGCGGRPSDRRDFNPRTPCGVRHVGLRAGHQHGHFNPRTPCGVRPATDAAALATLYFNPRTPCGVRLCGHHVVHLHHLISIHAPLAGCDNCAYPPPVCAMISIHAPLAGCDCRRGRDDAGRIDFNPRTPCGVRRMGKIRG